MFTLTLEIIVLLINVNNANCFINTTIVQNYLAMC